MAKELALVLSNKVNISDSYTQVVELCGNQAQQYEYSADPGSYGNVMSFNNIVPVGSLGSTLLSKKMAIRYTVTIVVTDNVANPVSHTFPAGSYYDSINQAVGPAGINGVNSGLRAFPLQSICENISIAINNNQVSWQARDTLSGLQRLINKKLLMDRSSTCPCRPDDQFQNFPDFATVNNQPLNINAKSQLGYSRNSITASSYNKVGSVATYVFNITEPLVIPGINTLYDNEQMLANVNNLTLILNYSKLNGTVDNGYGDFVSAGAVWSAGTQVAYNDTMAITISNPFLVLEYQAVSPALVTIPPSVVYPYESVYYSPKSVGTINTRDTTTTLNITSDTVRFASLPKKILVWVRRTMSSRTTYDADACLALVPNKGCFQANLGTRSGLLAQCSRDELWSLGKAAGSNQSRDSFCSGAGSFLLIDPITMFGVNPEAGEVLPGENSSLNFYVQGQYQVNNCIASLQGTVANSLLPTAADFELVIVALYEGQMIATPSSYMYNTGILTSAEVEQLVKTGTSVSGEAIKKEMNGAGLYTMKGVLHKGGKKRGGVLTMA
jgi:hypothetical protein